MQRAIVDIAAATNCSSIWQSQRNVDAASMFSETLTSLIAEPVAATLRSIEQTRGAFSRGDADRCISF